ncbi:MAG: GDSL-type esterase/lipase family protein [Sphingobacteriaceae bacterium]
MKLLTKLLCLAIVSIFMISCRQQMGLFLTLDGQVLNNVRTKGNSMPYLQIFPAKSPKGTVVIYPYGEIKNDSITSLFNRMGFSVAILKGSNLKLADAIKAFRFIKSKSSLNLNNDYTAILGFTSGGKLAALTTYELAEKERPDDLILINATGYDETAPGTVFPLINAPLSTKTRLLCIADTVMLNKTALIAFSEYTKTWIGYDGIAFFKEIADAKNPISGNKKLIEVLASFYNGDMTLSTENVNPAAVPVEGSAQQRHAEKTNLVKNHQYDLLFVGNSITHNWEKPEYQAVWRQYFGSRNAINLGYSGYRTENIIWNIQNGELENQTPKVIILEIGTNNIDEKNYPTRHTAGQLAGGMAEIVKIFREKCPDSKIIVLRCFPGCYGGPNPTSHRRILERASDIVANLADNKHIFYCDVNRVFLNKDGSINHEFMPDWLHPNNKGAELWAQAMETLLSKLMEDQSHDTRKP